MSLGRGIALELLVQRLEDLAVDLLVAREPEPSLKKRQNTDETHTGLFRSIEKGGPAAKLLLWLAYSAWPNSPLKVTESVDDVDSGSGVGRLGLDGLSHCCEAQ